MVYIGDFFAAYHEKKPSKALQVLVNEIPPPLSTQRPWIQYCAAPTLAVQCSCSWAVDITSAGLTVRESCRCWTRLGSCRVRCSGSRSPARRYAPPCRGLHTPTGCNGLSDGRFAHTLDAMPARAFVLVLCAALVQDKAPGASIQATDRHGQRHPVKVPAGVAPGSMFIAQVPSPNGAGLSEQVQRNPLVYSEHPYYYTGCVCTHSNSELSHPG